MIHSRTQILHALIVALALLSLCCRASAQSNQITNAASQSSKDQLGFLQGIDEDIPEIKELKQREASLMNQMSDEQLQAYAALQAAPNGNTAEQAICARKFVAAMESNPVLSDAFLQYLQDFQAIYDENQALRKEYTQLKQRSEKILQTINMYYQFRTERKAAAQAYMDSYIQRQNQQRTINEQTNIETTIQNQRSGGRW